MDYRLDAERRSLGCHIAITLKVERGTKEWLPTTSVSLSFDNHGAPEGDVGADYMVPLGDDALDIGETKPLALVLPELAQIAAAALDALTRDAITLEAERATPQHPIDTLKAELAAKEALAAKLAGLTVNRGPA